MREITEVNHKLVLSLFHFEKKKKRKTIGDGVRDFVPPSL